MDDQAYMGTVKGADRWQIGVYLQQGENVMKKIVIDISDKAYAHTKNIGYIWIEDKKEIADAINDGKVLPVFETNGDMIQYMLGQFVYSCNLDNGIIEVCLKKGKEEIIIQCSEAWWNAPYKEKRK